MKTHEKLTKPGENQNMPVQKKGRPFKDHITVFTIKEKKQWQKFN